MNANELADRLEQGHWEGGTREQAATMLRQQQEKLTKYELRHVAQRDRIAILEMQHKQQQAEIEELKTCLIVEQEHNELMVEDRSKYEALAHAGGVEVGKELKTLTDDPLVNFKPVWQEKSELTLTDEEIRKVADEVFKDYKNWHHYQIDFARAILRKAQEK